MAYGDHVDTARMALEQQGHVLSSSGFEPQQPMVWYLQLYKGSAGSYLKCRRIQG